MWRRISCALAVTALWSCGGEIGSVEEEPPAVAVQCPPAREVWHVVSDPAQVRDEEFRTETPGVCPSVTVVHHVLAPEREGAGGGGGIIPVQVGVPFGYFERQCQWDACGGPLPPMPRPETRP